MINTYAVKIQNLIPDRFEKFLTFVQEEKQLRIRSFKRPDDAKRALISDVLVKYIIMHTMNAGIDEIRIEINEYGKPYLAGCRDFHFNVSHSNQWVICAFGTSPVGADIEYMAPIDPLFVKRFFSEEEFSDIFLRDPKDRVSYFYKLWTLKESYIKAVGKGLFIPLDSFCVKPGKNGEIFFKSMFDSSKYYFSGFDFDGKYRISLCSKDSSQNGNIIIKNQEDICDGLLSAGCRN